jgi:transcription initiation factor IIE alpha subunit
MCGHGPWGGYGMIPGQMPWGMGYGYRYGMRCPVCGELMMKPSKEEIIEMLERRKKRLEGVLEHINMEITRLKENKPEE